jgi:hypothetical protein
LFCLAVGEKEEFMGSPGVGLEILKFRRMEGINS